MIDCSKVALANFLLINITYLELKADEIKPRKSFLLFQFIRIKYFTFKILKSLEDFFIVLKE